ncbi:hypothetical protein MJ588_01375 [Klebsiella pneumoniae]|nr:hypothetical protein MJ588_01375 [Klebsiella pneumoniae]
MAESDMIRRRPGTGERGISHGAIPAASWRSAVSSLENRHPMRVWHQQLHHRDPGRYLATLTDRYALADPAQPEYFY